MRRHLALPLMFAATAAFAQVRESVNVTVVEVPVTVVDSSGNPVRGLTAANFELFDQGKKRDITSFDTIDFAARDSSAISPLIPAARRSFLLLFDLGFSSPNSLARAQEAARRFVKESVQPRDLVGVATIDVDRGFHLVAAFTVDRELIASAIGNPLTYKGTDPLQIANGTVVFRGEEEIDLAPPEKPKAGVAICPDCDVWARQQGRELAGAAAHVNEGAARQRVEKEIEALAQLANSLRGLPGRKQIIFLSEGFDAKYVLGRDARATTETRKENDAVLSGDVANVDTDQRYGSSTSATLVERMARTFRSSDVVLHAIDIKGLRVQNDAEGSTINSNAGLSTLARPTGGEVFQNSNDLKDNFARMLRAQEVVYVVGFQTSASKPGAFHDLKVKVVNVPGARVAHRAGYFEGGGVESAAERSLTDAEIIINDIAQRDVRVDALAAAFPVDPAHAQVPVVLEINGEDLLRGTKDGNPSAEIYVYAFDRDGVVRDRLYEKMRLDTAKAGDRLQSSGAKFIAMLTLPPGEYAVKALVRVPDGNRRGFARASVTVPQWGQLAVQPFFIDEQPRQWVLVRGTTLDPSNYPFQIGGQAVVPTAAPRLRSGEHRRFAVFVSNSDIEDLRVDTAVLRANGTTAPAKPKMIDKGQSGSVAKLMFDYEATALDLGAAALQVVVHRNGSTDSKSTVPLVVSQ